MTDRAFHGSEYIIETERRRVRRKLLNLEMYY